MADTRLTREEWRARIGGDDIADAELDRIIAAIESGRPTAEVDENGVDISQLRRNRQLTPLQRATKMVKAARFFHTIQGMAARKR